MTPVFPDNRFISIEASLMESRPCHPLINSFSPCIRKAVSRGAAQHAQLGEAAQAQSSLVSAAGTSLRRRWSPRDGTDSLETSWKMGVLRSFPSRSIRRGETTMVLANRTHLGVTYGGSLVMMSIPEQPFVRGKNVSGRGVAWWLLRNRPSFFSFPSSSGECLAIAIFRMLSVGTPPPSSPCRYLLLFSFGKKVN